MGFFLTIILFVLLDYFAIRLIAYLANKYSSKRIDDIDKIDALAACLTSSFGYIIYLVCFDKNEPGVAMTVQNFSDFISLTKTLFTGMLIGGLVLLCGIGACILPFVAVHEKFARHYNIQEKLIFKVYCSMFLMTTLSISIVTLIALYLTM